MGMSLDGTARKFAMCGIAGVFGLSGQRVDRLEARLRHMNALQKHRGPDGEGVWRSPSGCAGLGHVRLSILDLSGGAQPMVEPQSGLVVVLNGEIYNFRELRRELEGRCTFITESDTEVVLHAYREWGEACVERFRGMFAFAIWNERRRELFLARDRFGIKPLYTARVGDHFYFASEIKALLPFLPEVRIDRRGLRDYLAFQFYLQGKTLFQDVHEVPPATRCRVGRRGTSSETYWRVSYDIDQDHTDRWFCNQCRELIDDSVRAHLVSDVPVGSYLSGGTDSSALAVLARRQLSDPQFLGFHGRFDAGPRYDESACAREVASAEGMLLKEVVIRSRDFAESFDRVIYHLDCPVAGPGSFPQYKVSQLVKGNRKVVLGGQGGDEIFGGYVRYLIAYFEQCFKGAIEGNADSSKFIVTYESIIPNLQSLRGYQPLMAHFFGQGMFEDYDKRYYRLVDRSGSLGAEVRWENFTDYDPYDSFREVFFSNPVGHKCYFDSMLHFDFVTLLPALLQVEDRMSMAHGIESRTPLLDHPLVELLATIPANVKFKAGELKRLPRKIFQDVLPASVLGRKDKMGFPVPLVEWFKGELRPLVEDALSSPSTAGQEFLNYREILKGLAAEKEFGRKIWGFLCLDSFCKQFVDRHVCFEDLPHQPAASAEEGRPWRAAA
jgi:asparagine synthase (glutamine-hydrolysing)